MNVIIEYGLSAEIILSKNNSLMFLSVTSYWQDINILKISRRLAPALGELGRAVEGLNPSAGLTSALLCEEEQNERCQSYKIISSRTLTKQLETEFMRAA